MRRAPLLAALVLLAGLAGCGEPSVDGYCEQLREDREQLAEMVSSGSPTALLEGLDVLRELRDEAPRDLRDEWDTFVTALEGLEEALSEAGASASDFEDGEPPEGLEEDELAAVTRAAERVRAADVVEAAGGIETQARDVCKVNLGV